MLHATRWKYRTQKSPSAHYRATLSGCIFAIKACIDSWKKNLLNSNISLTCPHNMANVGPLMAEIGSRVWGTSANFSGAPLNGEEHGCLIVCAAMLILHVSFSLPRCTYISLWSFLKTCLGIQNGADKVIYPSSLK